MCVARGMVTSILPQFLSRRLLIRKAGTQAGQSGGRWRRFSELALCL